MQPQQEFDGKGVYTLQVRVEQSTGVSFPPAPEHVILTTKALGGIHGCFDLRGRVCMHRRMWAWTRKNAYFVNQPI